MIKFIFILVFMVMILSKSHAESIQTITIDNEQIKMGKYFSDFGSDYFVDPAKEINLDASSYIFEGRGWGNIPQKISIFIYGDQRFYVPWVKGKKIYKLDSSTLVPHKDNTMKFVEFKAGDSLWIYIGQDQKSKGGSEINVTLWVGIVRVDKISKVNE